MLNYQRVYFLVAVFKCAMDAASQVVQEQRELRGQEA